MAREAAKAWRHAEVDRQQHIAQPRCAGRVIDEAGVADRQEQGRDLRAARQGLGDRSLDQDGLILAGAGGTTEEVALVVSDEAHYAVDRIAVRHVGLGHADPELGIHRRWLGIGSQQAPARQGAAHARKSVQFASSPGSRCSACTM